MSDSPLHDVVRAVHELFLVTSDRVADDLATLGLTHATATALWAIDPDEPAPSMKVLAQRLFCHAPTSASSWGSWSPGNWSRAASTRPTGARARSP